MIQTNLETESAVSATQNVNTKPTIPVEWKNNSLSYAYTLLKEMSLYQVLLKHPEWFDSASSLTYEFVSTQNDIKENNDLLSVLKRVDEESGSRKDQDFATKINIFRGNFFTRFIGQWTMLLKHFEAVPGYEQVVKNWFGQDYQKLSDYISSFAQRIGIRKNASSQEIELVLRLKKIVFSSFEKTFVNPKDMELLQRIEEYREVQWVTDKEIEKAFEINDLLILFYENWRNKRDVTEADKEDLIGKVLRPVETPMPKITPLDETKYGEKQPEL